MEGKGHIQHEGFKNMELLHMKDFHVINIIQEIRSYLKCYGRTTPPSIPPQRRLTTFHSTTEETLFKLTFGINAVIPVEIGEPFPRTLFFQLA
ncbi:hypothetical protein CR513_55608, partial [Mucuna pruriens]